MPMAGTRRAVVKEGWLTKKAIKSGWNWKRRYVVLDGSALIYYDDQPTAANEKGLKPRGIVEVTAKSIVRLSAEKKQHAFEVVRGSQELVMHAESKEDKESWMEAIKSVVNKLKESDKGEQVASRRGWLVKRAVKSGRNWKKRFFVLHNGRLTYYEHIPSSSDERPKGLLEIGPDTVVREAATGLGFGGKKHAFYVETPEHTLHVSAESIAERDMWISALHLAVLHKCGIERDAAVRVGVWMRQQTLQQYCVPVIKHGGFESFDKLAKITEDEMKAIFRHANFTMNDARRFQLAIRELQGMEPAARSALGLISDLVRPGYKAPKSMSKRLSNRFNKLVQMESKGSADSAAAATPAPAAAAAAAASASPDDIIVPPAILERRLYTWGDDSEMQLGIGSSAGGITSEPTYVQALKNKTEPLTVFAGARCMAGISKKDGSLFTWGSGPALGLGAARSVSNRPFLVSTLRKYCIVQVCVGSAHMVAVTDEGDAFSWGEGPQGQLGLGRDILSAQEPMLVDNVGTDEGIPVAMAKCSPNHTLFLTRDGRVFSCGSGKKSRLGHTLGKNAYSPQVADGLGGFEIGQIAAGDDFSLALAADGVCCFVWGQLASDNGPPVPVRIEPFDERPVDQIDAAGECAIFLVNKATPGAADPEEASVYTVGGNPMTLGHGDENPRLQPTRVEALEGHGVSQVSISATHAAALCSDGRLLMWGEDERGQLGNGYLVNVARPHTAVGIAGYKYISVSCGVDATAAVAEYDPDFRASSEENLAYGVPLTPPPPPEETIVAEDAKQEKFTSMMESLAELTHMIEKQEEEEEGGLPPGTVQYCEGWLQHTDRKTGKKYFEEEATGNVQWKPPKM